MLIKSKIWKSNFELQFKKKKKTENIWDILQLRALEYAKFWNIFQLRELQNRGDEGGFERKKAREEARKEIRTISYWFIHKCIYNKRCKQELVI